MLRQRYEIIFELDQFPENILTVLATNSEIVTFFYILHDRDVRKPHFHLVVDFGSLALASSKVANWFGVPECNVLPCTSNNKAINIRILLHEVEHLKELYRYKAEQIVANFNVINELRYSQAEILKKMYSA